MFVWWFQGFATLSCIYTFAFKFIPFDTMLVSIYDTLNFIQRLHVYNILWRFLDAFQFYDVLNIYTKCIGSLPVYTMLFHLSSFIFQLSSYTFLLSSFTFHLSSFIVHLSTFVFHFSSFIFHLLFLFYLSSFRGRLKYEGKMKDE